MTTSLAGDDAKRKKIEALTYTVAEVAARLGVSERHIHRLRDQRRLPGELKIGRSVRFSKSIIDGWLSTAVLPTNR